MSYDALGYVFGDSILRKDEKSLAGFKLKRCLEVLGKKQGKLLEVGCGGGRYCRAIKFYKPHLKVHGSDINKNAISINKKAKDNVEYRYANAEKLPYKDKEFDFVVLFDVLEHVRDINKSVKEINRVIKKGGIFHCCFPCEANKSSLYKLACKLGINYYKLKEKQYGHIQRFTWKEFINLLGKNGFNVNEIAFDNGYYRQLIDIITLSVMELPGMSNLFWETHLETSIKKKNKYNKVLLSILKGFKRLIEGISYYENVLVKMRKLGAIGIEVTSKKR